MKKLCFFILLFFSANASCYSNFIGIGYGSCLTCHFNGAGGGPLNDYGRALFAAEIAAKPFWNKSADDETLGNQSGAVGSIELPIWFRPGYKYRNLNFQEKPGLKDSELEYYNMQSDISIAVSFDVKQNYVLVTSFGNAPKPYLERSFLESYDGNGLISREHYFRAKIASSSWLYLGLMDKVFGIRHPDHTSFNRSYLNIGQNDQVYATQFHNIHEGGEFFIQPYIDNTLRKVEKRYNGVAVSYEKETTIKRRYGLNLIYESNKTEARERIGVTARLAVGEGNSALFEIGKKTNTPKGANGTTGAYGFAEGQIRLTRGLFFQSLGEYVKGDINQSGLENFKWGLGFIYFPAQRIELRLGSITQRIINDTSVEEDKWAVQSQLHLSL